MCDIELVSRAAFETVSGETAFHFCLIVIKTLQVLLCGLVTKCMADECEDDLTLNKCGKHPVRPFDCI